MNIDQQLDARQARRICANNRSSDRMERREAIAETMIGELSSGALYVYPAGSKYVEGQRHELVAYLIRNNFA